LLVTTSLFGGTGITAPTAGAFQWWGAIAISPTTGKVGSIGLCNARDCQAVVNFTNACGAVAQAFNTSWGAGWDHNSTGAQNRALISCSQYGPGCRVIGWICT
jgi:Domain of unknown function (DUF4189)